MKKPILRAYYGGIFFEFILQDRNADAVVILPGFPGRNDYNSLIGLFFDRGYHVFVPRYRGSFQSSGSFLSKNPIDDLIMFMQHLDKGMVKSLWDNKKINFKVHKKILLAANFSGAIACGLAVKSKAFSHLILASPIWDYQKHNERFDEQNLQQMTEFAKRAYKNVYRINFPNIINRLAKFKELKPEYYVPLLTLPVLVLHDPNDTMVAFRHTKEMIAKLQNVTYLEHYLGHGLSDSLINAFWKEIDKFIKINYI